MKSTTKEWAHHLIITVDIVITILEISLKRRISTVTNTINHHPAEVINLHIIVVINMKNKSTCRRRERRLHAPWEIREETTPITMEDTLSKTTIIINTTTSSRAAKEATRGAMEISNNKKVMEAVATDPLRPPMKTRLINKLFLL